MYKKYCNKSIERPKEVFNFYHLLHPYSYVHWLLVKILEQFQNCPAPKKIWGQSFRSINQNIWQADIFNENGQNQNECWMMISRVLFKDILWLATILMRLT
jgi:hypothetical protein